MTNAYQPDILWRPSDRQMETCRLRHFMQWLVEHRNLRFDDYDALWQWSTAHPAQFWVSVWDYFEVKSHTPYSIALTHHPMPNARWFYGARINYAEMIFDKMKPEGPVIYHLTEDHVIGTLNKQDLEKRVASMAAWLRAAGAGEGDRVAAWLPNVPEAVIAMLAAASIGAVWSSCSPDFGAASVMDRFRQIEPKVLLTTNGYTYGGKSFDRMATAREIASELPSLTRIGLIPYPGDKFEAADFWTGETEGRPPVNLWSEIMAFDGGALTFTPVEFSHPIYILFSSGTTGIPKAITHGHGGVLLEHLKYLAFHNDVRPGENFFWYSTTGWMMWNFTVAALLSGAAIVLYDGSPAYPDLPALWRLADELPIHHFGTSAPFLVSCMKAGLKINETFRLEHLRTIGSTGSPLPPEAFDYVYQSVKSDVWLASMSGGTDVCTAWVGGQPFAPVRRGEIQTRCLGCAMESYDEAGKPVRDEVGEMVVTQPMPSMPVFFWNDPDMSKYEASYFEHYAGIWRHGDWLRISAEGTLAILGRSDATLNRQGVRIGTAEIYRVLDGIPELRDALIVNLELEGGQHFMPLFVVLSAGQTLTDDLKKKINTALRTTCSPRHVPDEIVAVDDLPYTISGKKMEAPVKKILLGIAPEKAANPGSVRNPSALAFFVQYRKAEWKMG